MKKESGVGDRYTKWFSDLGKEDTAVVGGKGANLGEMYNLGIPVPPGFCITTEGYQYFLEETGLKDEIYKILGRLNVEDTAELEERAKEIQQIIIKSDMPDDLQEEILDNYEALNIDEKTLENASSTALAILKKGYEPIFVAVRSSATAEDTAAASFAGQQETFLNIKGRLRVIEAVKRCFASLFTARSIYYRVKKKFEHEKILISVVIQAMINSDKSGVMFSKDPMSGSENIVIEAVYGLGEGIVSGRISPDNYVVSRKLELLSKNMPEKKIAITRNSSGENVLTNLTQEKSRSQVLSLEEIKSLARYSLELESHYKKPQDIEFAIDSGKIYIVQTRPITTLEMKRDRNEISGKEILKGLGASPGIGSGVVKIVRDLKDLVKIKKGDVLVTKMTNPDMVVSMQRSAAIVTDEGGLTCHAAIISREMGIPAVVGTDLATKTLKDGQEITVDGSNGKVFLGRHEGVKVEIKKVVETQTKIKTIVDLPDFASRAAETGIKSIGLVRLEGIIAESGKHPLFFYKNNKVSEYEKMIFLGLKKISEYFDELWIRTSDIRSDEYANLEGAPRETELNPMLGMHGIRASLKKPELLEAELKAMSAVAKLGKRMGVMMPQIISVEEVEAVKKMLSKLEIDNLVLGVMIETPAAVQIIDELCSTGIKFISFGTNDLTQYTLAIDRGNEDVQYLYDELNPAVLKQLAYVTRKCKKYGVESSICGQAASNPKMAEFLIREGIDSLSVNADKAYEISALARELESKGLRGSSSRELDMAKKKAVIEEIDDTKHLEREEKKIVEKVEEEKEKEEKKKKEVEENIETEKSSDFPDVDIGIDIFSQH